MPSQQSRGQRVLGCSRKIWASVVERGLVTPFYIGVLLVIGFACGTVSTLLFLTIRLDHPLVQIILSIGPWGVAGVSVYALYHTTFKGPDIKMTAETKDGVGTISVGSPPEPIRVGEARPTRHPSLFEGHVYVVFFNAGSRTGVVKDFSVVFKPDPAFQEFLQSKHSKRQPFYDKLTGGTLDAEEMRQHMFIVNDREAVGWRVRIQFKLNLETGNASSDFSTRRKKWCEFIKGEPPSYTALLGEFHIRARRTERYGNFANLPSRVVELHGTKKLIAKFKDSSA